MKNQTNMNLLIRSSLALALAMAIWSPVQTLSAEPPERNMMNHSGGWMNGWSGGGMWIGTVIGALVVVLLVVVIIKLTKK